MPERPAARQDPWLVRWGLTLAAVGVVGVLVIVPVINVFYQALAHGVGTYVHNLVADPDTRHAILLTLTVAPVAVVLNVVFGVAAAWAIARYQFPGRTAADHAHRPALLGLAGRGRPDVRALVRAARVLRPVAA